MTTFLLAQNTPWFGANGFGLILHVLEGQRKLLKTIFL
jgi:hypothetical protein